VKNALGCIFYSGIAGLGMQGRAATL